MARTYRRKGSDESYKRWFVGEESEVTEWELKRYNVKTPKEFVVKRAVRYHSDSFVSMKSAPKQFRKILKRKVKQKSKANIERAWVRDEWDGFSNLPDVRDAAWFWW